MTRFRLNAGRPATPARGGSSARPPEKAAEIKRVRYWAPNMEPPVPLTCGHSIPWPVMRLIGSAKDAKDRQVWCDQHGWQKVIRRDEPPCSPTSQSTFPDLPPF